MSRWDAFSSEELACIDDALVGEADLTDDDPEIRTRVALANKLLEEIWEARQ